MMGITARRIQLQLFLVAAPSCVNEPMDCIATTGALAKLASACGMAELMLLKAVSFASVANVTKLNRCMMI